MKINLINFICIFLLGGSIASFYHVFVTRRHLKKNYFLGRSKCDNCNKELKFYEIIPVISFIFLKGKCSKCKGEIGIDKFITEVLASSIAVIFFIKYGLTITTYLSIIISIILIFIGLIDFKTGYIYNIDLFILFILTLIYKIVILDNVLISFKYGSIIFLIFFSLYFFTKMMGLGDVLYSFIMGFYANSKIETFELFKNAFIYAAIFSIILILLKKKSSKDEIAFGPFMSMSILIFLLFYR